MFTPFSARTASAYQRINVETSMHTIDQHQLVSLLFEGILQSIATARGALARGDIAAKCAAVAKALRILEEGLMTALDREAGGELAANLGAVYDYALQQLILANARNDDALLGQVARLFEPIAQSWNEIKNHPAPVAPVAAANDMQRHSYAEA
ncbi:flagellar export chaperone FliS [Melaminivora jejuensis]|uniref:flagellar export chaperone FliS n=1 Tax=Melaminivora jejuensis TaxID=1267217 RepID=UPI001ADFB4BC|nr:flagellar export chaperone FliS [Melaminivora jejuensis]UHJ64619.1 flagellar export chaperone FliS [Melaminivora jejuensis]